MVESTTAGNYKVGISRLRYLDTCNFQFIQGNMEGAKEAVNAFLSTILDTTVAGKELQENIKLIEEKRIKLHKELRSEIDKKGFLEQSLEWNDGHTQIDIETLLDVKAACWAVALGHGLFNE